MLKSLPWSYAAVMGAAFCYAPILDAQPAAPANVITSEALAPLVGGPTMVTLQGKDIPLKTAVEALMEAAKLPTDGVLNQGEATRTVTVNWKDMPFWEAAKDLEQQTGLQWVNASLSSKQEAPLYLVNKRSFSPQHGGLIGLSGAKTPLAMVVASQVAHSTQQVLNLGSPTKAEDASDSDTTSVRLIAYFDPNIRLSPNPVKVQMTMPPDLHPIVYRDSPISWTGVEAVVFNDFEIPVVAQGKQTKIPLIAGSLLADVVVKSETWEVPNITVNTTATREINGVTYKLENVTLDDDKLTVKTTSQSLVRGTPTIFPLRILDGQGALVPSNGGSSSMSTTDAGASYKGEYSYSLRVRSKGFPTGEVRPGPFKLVWDIPTDVQTLKVPFEFRDVPLP